MAEELPSPDNKWKILNILRAPHRCSVVCRSMDVCVLCTLNHQTEQLILTGFINKPCNPIKVLQTAAVIA